MENTKTYKTFKYPFNTFNPVQTEVRTLLKKKNNNMVISANTSSGKTVCAEFMIDQELKKGNRVIYLSPLKSLAEEKFEDWKKRFRKEKITIVTSDYRNSKKMLKGFEDSSIIILTSEMLDHKTRTYNKKKSLWIEEIGLVIIDESHIISSENRGSAVEASIIRFSLLNKKARILLLSATMSNGSEFKEWLTALNGKFTDVVESTWRPVELTFHYEPYKAVLKESNYNNGSMFLDYIETEKKKIEKVVSIVLKKVSKEKFLIFVHSKATGRMVVKMLEEEGIESIFHNSNLSKSERREIENDFKDKDSDLKVLVSTSTLAWGVNLPARNVVIVGVKRGMDNVDPLDIIQMAGRAGRYGIDDAGDVYLILLPGIIDTWKNNFNNPRPLSSKLDSPKSLAFHLLAEINNGIVKNDEELVVWYKKTLRYLQYPQVPSCVDPLLIPSLRKIFMIEESDPFKTTKLGRISSIMYFSPYDVYAWYCNCRNLVNIENLDDYQLSKALFDVPKNESWIPKNSQKMFVDFEQDLSRRSIKVRRSSLMHVFVGYKCLCGDTIEGGILNVIKREMMFDIDRVVVAVNLINATIPNGEILKDIVDGISLRIKYGIPIEAVELVRIKGIGSVRAEILIENDIHNAFDVVDKRNRQKLLDIFSVRVCKSMVLNSREYIKARNSVSKRERRRKL